MPIMVVTTPRGVSSGNDRMVIDDDVVAPAAAWVPEGESTSGVGQDRKLLGVRRFGAGVGVVENTCPRPPAEGLCPARPLSALRSRHNLPSFDTTGRAAAPAPWSSRAAHPAGSDNDA